MSFLLVALSVAVRKIGRILTTFLSALRHRFETLYLLDATFPPRNLPDSCLPGFVSFNPCFEGTMSFNPCFCLINLVFALLILPH